MRHRLDTTVPAAGIRHVKQPKPWFWEKRNAWYVTLCGKQLRLHEKEREANAEFYRIMAAEGGLTGQQVARMTVADACEVIISTAAHSRSSTLRLYRDMLGPFAAHFRAKRLDQLTPDECVRFVSTYQGTGYKGKTFGDSSRALMFRYIKTLFKWARDTGLLQMNPMVRVTNPWKIRSRERPMSEVEYLTIMGDRRLNDRFKEVLEIIWRTGARPGEAPSSRPGISTPVIRSPGSNHPNTRPAGKRACSARFISRVISWIACVSIRNSDQRALCCGTPGASRGHPISSATRSAGSSDGSGWPMTA